VDYLTQARAYLALTDAMPKPYPMPETARKQFIELREDIERFESYFHALLDQKERQLRSPDRDNIRRYAEANEKLSPPAPNATRVVFMGDSITDSWRLNEYFTGREYVNRGISGQVTGEMLGRMKADVLDLHPKAVIVLAGTNDIARGVAAKTIENNIAMIADLCRANNIKPLFASILPVSDYHKSESPRFEMTKTHPQSTIVEVNNWIREYCQAHHYVYVDYYNALRDPNGQLPTDAADDGLHPNAKGYRMMAPVAMKALDQALGENSPAEQAPATAAKKKRLF
jgi:lysophospholipase L1-like esterase